MENYPVTSKMEKDTPSLFYNQLEQMKMLHGQSALTGNFDENLVKDLSLFYQNPTIFYSANPLLWQHLIFSLPHIFPSTPNTPKTEKTFTSNESIPGSPFLTSSSKFPFNRSYMLTPETPEKDDIIYEQGKILRLIENYFLLYPI